MIQRFTEMYYDDAVRFAQYIQATEGGEIELVKEALTFAETIETTATTFVDEFVQSYAVAGNYIVRE